MKTVILCGGKGTRMREETEFRPKPLVMIGDQPIIWHIMKIYSFYGFRDFILCVGYKGDMIKRYILEMCWRSNDFTVKTGPNPDILYHSKNEEEWRVTIVDTGQESNTGTRIRQIEDYIDSDEFMLTYGDGLADVNLSALIKNHRDSGRIATLTGVNPTSPFGVLQIEEDRVTAFREKPILEDVINGGFMVLRKDVFAYIPDKDCAFEGEPLHRLAGDGQLGIYKHDSFWTAIDTYKDVERVKEYWSAGTAPWKIWN